MWPVASAPGMSPLYSGPPADHLKVVMGGAAPLSFSALSKKNRHTDAGPLPIGTKYSSYRPVYFRSVYSFFKGVEKDKGELGNLCQESQVARNHRPLYPEVAQNLWKVTHNYRPPAFQILLPTRILLPNAPTNLLSLELGEPLLGHKLRSP